MNVERSGRPHHRRRRSQFNNLSMRSLGTIETDSERLVMLTTGDSQTRSSSDEMWRSGSGRTIATSMVIGVNRGRSGRKEEKGSIRRQLRRAWLRLSRTGSLRKRRGRLNNQNNRIQGNRRDRVPPLARRKNLMKRLRRIKRERNVLDQGPTCNMVMYAVRRWSQRSN